MSKTEVQHVLVVGIDTVPIVNSAKEAGYSVFAADYFGDLDLQRICSGYEAIIQQEIGKSCGKIGSRFKPQAFLEATKSLHKRHRLDAILLSSGLDDFFDVVRQLNSLIPVLGNSPEVIERVRTKPKFYEELECLEIAHPETIATKNISELKATAEDIGYPVVIKPTRGFGGIGVRLARSTMEVEEAFQEASSIDGEVLAQRFIKGVHASVSFLAAEDEATILTVNEQILGSDFLFQEEPLGYCGNIVPLHLSDSIFDKCKNILERIASHFDLKGSNGVDLVISKEGDPYVIEVNPRFQGSLECVEKVLGINLVESHINACLYDSLPIQKAKASGFCTRLILYTPNRIVAPNITAFREARDIPLPGTIIEKSEPLCSVIAAGISRSSSLRKAKTSAKNIYKMLQTA